jgi:hypothetical protein
MMAKSTKKKRFVFQKVPIEKKHKERVITNIG